MLEFLKSDDFKLWRAEEAERVLALEACLLCGEESPCISRVFERSGSYATDNVLESTINCVEPHALESIVHIYPWFLSFIVAVDNLPIAVSIASVEIKDEELKCPIIYANKQFESLVHYPLEFILGKDSSFFCKGKDRSLNGLTYADELKNSVYSRTYIQNLYHSPTGRKGKDMFRNLIVSKPMYNENKECKYVVTIHHNVENFSRLDRSEFSKPLVHVFRCARLLIHTLPSTIHTSPDYL
jgi:hypothetical protein